MYWCYYRPPVVNLYPLCSENFDRLVVNSKAGIRLIVILVDDESKTKLLQQFASVIHQYSRYVKVSLHIRELCERPSVGLNQ